jgi:hypothetical protein
VIGYHAFLHVTHPRDNVFPKAALAHANLTFVDPAGAARIDDGDGDAGHVMRLYP